MKKITLLISIVFLFISSILWAQPSNNLCSGAMPLTVGTNCTLETVTFSGTETDSGVASPGCANYVGGDLWFSVIVPSTGAVTVKTEKDSFSGPTSIDNGGMAIYTGDCNNLVLYQCNDNGNSTVALFEQITFVGTVGETIFVRLWQNGTTGAGTHRICAYSVDPPMIASNDESCTATSLILNNPSLIATNFQATVSTQTAPSCVAIDGPDVWFKIDVPDDKFYDITIETFENPGSDINDTGIAVYSATACSSLNFPDIGCDDDGGNGFFSKILLSNKRNETLYLRVFPVSSPQIGTFKVSAIGTQTLNTKEESFSLFTMYPNPASDFVTLKFGENFKDKIEVNIYDIQGKLVLKTLKTLQNNKVELPVFTLGKGMYFLKANDGLNTVAQKLIIK